MDLPLEIQVDIFNNLDVTSLKQCLLVSQEFRNVILSSSILMRKFLIILDANSVLKKLEFLKSTGSHLKRLKIDDHGPLLTKFLAYTPNLHSLKIHCNKSRFQVSQQHMKDISDYVTENELQFRSLQEMAIIDSIPVNAELILSRFLNCSSLNSFHIEFVLSKINELTEIDSLRMFLEQQKSLRDFKIVGIHESDNFFENFDQFEFKLKKLWIGWNGLDRNDNSTTTYENFLIFMKKQAENLEELKFGHCATNDDPFTTSNVRLIEQIMCYWGSFDILSVLSSKSENHQKISLKNLKTLQIWSFAEKNCGFDVNPGLEVLDTMYHKHLLDVNNWRILNEKLPALKIFKIQAFMDETDKLIEFLYENFVKIFDVMKNVKKLHINTHSFVILIFERELNDKINLKVYCHNLRKCIGKRATRIANNFKNSEMISVDSFSFVKFMDIQLE